MRDWIAAEREFLAWRSGLDAARRASQATPDSWKDDTLLRGVALEQAHIWLAKRSNDIPEVDRDFIVLSRKAAQRRKMRKRALFGVLTLAILMAYPRFSSEDGSPMSKRVCCQHSGMYQLQR